MSRKIIQTSKTINYGFETLTLSELSPDLITCRKAFEAFLFAKRQAGCREKTLSTYVCHVNEFIEWCEGIQLSISDIRKVHVERWEGILRLDRGNRDTSVQTKIKSIRTFLYWCMDEDRGWVGSFRIGLPKADTVLKTPYTREELELLLAQPKSDSLAEWRTWAAVSFFVRTGVRLSSALNLKWSDLDFEKRVCLLRHTKTNEQYFVPLPKETIIDLVTWQQVSPVTKEGFVFFSTRGDGPMKPNGLIQSVRKYNRARGVSKTSIHLLRHTYATIYLQKGGRAERLQKILGHKTSDMTQRYVHFVTDDLVEGIDDFTV